jgi:hypothetical protein
VPWWTEWGQALIEQYAPDPSQQQRQWPAWVGQEVGWASSSMQLTPSQRGNGSQPWWTRRWGSSEHDPPNGESNVYGGARRIRPEHSTLKRRNPTREQ